MKIWSISNEKIEIIIDTYIDYVTNPFSWYRQTNNWKNEELNNLSLHNNTITPPEYRVLIYNNNTNTSRKDNLPYPKKDSIRPHFISLLHQLYLRFVSSRHLPAVLNTSILQQQYRYYNYMLDALKFQNVIQMNSESRKNFATTSFTIPNPHDFKMIECKHKVVINDLTKCSKIFTKLHQEKIENAKKQHTSLFINQYNKMIKKYKLINEIGAQSFIDTNKFETEHSKLYYKHIISKLKSGESKEIEGSDNNGRIYHIGTLTPKLIKQFTNISTSIDCKNSHPMLFNYFILDYYFNQYNISINNAYNIRHNNNKLYNLIVEYTYNNIDNIKTRFHYFMKHLRNELYNNNICADNIEKTRKIKRDVFLYIYNSSKGVIWDEIQKANPQFTRDEIKVVMFSSLFYSQRKNIQKTNIHALAFKKQYPQIAKILRYYKRTFHSQCKEQGFTTLDKRYDTPKDSIQLPHKLMQLESCIFKEILRRLFKLKEFQGFAIHDAIVVLNNSLDTEKTKNTMSQVFQEIGLHPTFSIDVYNSTHNA